jgi:hypothetical protein
MSNPERPVPEDEPEAPSNLLSNQGQRNQGPNLVVIYTLVALALAAAIGFALLIVFPFYHRR